MSCHGCVGSLFLWRPYKGVVRRPGEHGSSSGRGELWFGMDQSRGGTGVTFVIASGRYRIAAARGRS
jgi:hypothetical protein